MKTSGLDVHKDSIFCAIYDGKSYSAVKEFTTTTDSIRSLGEYLKSECVTKVAMKSTSTYLVPVWDILYEMEFEMKSVNPLHIKQMPGHKSNAKYAQWIAGLLFKNMLRGSPVLRPGNDENAGKFKSTATTKGNRYLNAIIVQVAKRKNAVQSESCSYL